VCGDSGAKEQIQYDDSPGIVRPHNGQIIGRDDKVGYYAIQGRFVVWTTLGNSSVDLLAHLSMSPCTIATTMKRRRMNEYMRITAC